MTFFELLQGIHGPGRINEVLYEEISEDVDAWLLQNPTEFKEAGIVAAVLQLIVENGLPTDITMQYDR